MLFMKILKLYFHPIFFHIFFLLKLMMTEKTVPPTSLSDHNNEGEESNQTAPLFNKCLKK